jgi:hypothetical protein
MQTFGKNSKDPRTRNDYFVKAPTKPLAFSVVHFAGERRGWTRSLSCRRDGPLSKHKAHRPGSTMIRISTCYRQASWS